MNKLLRASAFLWFTATSLFTYAQEAKPETVYRENIAVHINTDFLVTGEMLYYSIHCFQQEKNKYSSLSKLAYVELIGENEKPVIQNKIPLTAGRGAGDFFLPSTLPSGNYTLIAYTKWMRNFGAENFFQQQITIINPYLKPLSSATATHTGKSNTTAIASNQRDQKRTIHVHIESDKKKYSPRQKVIVTIKNSDPIHACNILLNVHSFEGISKSDSSKSAVRVESLVPSVNKELVTFLPDLRGETIGGVVREAGSGRAVPNTNVYLSIPGPSSIFQLSRTNSEGRFYFSTKNIHTETGIQFQVDQPSDIASIEIILDDEFIDDYKKFKPQPLSIDTMMRKVIEQRNVYGQIENAYFIKKRDSILTTTQQPFFEKPDKIFRLDDFTRFPTMEDIFREYMYEVVVSKRDGKFLIRLINSTTKNGARFLNTPLMMIDGIPIFDTEILMSYNPLLIKTVSIVTRPYVYGGVLFDGVLAINTYTGNAKDLTVKPIRKDYISWQHAKKYYSPVYTTPETLSRVPDYRIQLLWNPTITLAPGQEFIGEFYTSDVEGTFLMEVQGFNSIGQLVNVHERIEVRK